MEFYLIQHGHAGDGQVLDRRAAGLSPQGLEQSRRLAALCKQWGIDFIISSTIPRAQETADVISEALPHAIRWDLQEMDDLDIDERALSPALNPLRERWTPEQTRLAYERTWTRVMAALTRIELYARTRSLERIAIVTHEANINLILLNWLGLDWRAAQQVHFAIAWAGTCKVVLSDGVAHFIWLNRLSE